MPNEEEGAELFDKQVSVHVSARLRIRSLNSSLDLLRAEPGSLMHTKQADVSTGNAFVLARM